MKIFLAGTDLLKNYPDELKKSKYQLASFFNIQDWMMPFLNNCEEYLLDSGAFSFLNGKTGVDFDDYLDRYIEFINKNNVKNFFELDLDSIIGYKKVYQMREKLERETGRKSIPVWHKNRGVQEWKDMCEEYPYVAMGGIAIKEIKPEQYRAFPSMIAEAHRRGAKVHGLGFTSTSYFDKIKFDTVDSTTWNVGGKYGNICEFNPTTYMRQKIYSRSEPKRCVKQKELMIYNWNQWIKFQQYAETNL